MDIHETLAFISKRSVSTRPSANSGYQDPKFPQYSELIDDFCLITRLFQFSPYLRKQIRLAGSPL